MVSVVIPSYNRALTINRSVCSVLNQTYKDIEVIVVDDCSSDNTREVIESINDERLRYYCLEENSGACVARNKGIELAKGEYIAFQDSDDEWLPNKLEIQIKKLQASKADVCFCKMKQFFSDGSSEKFFPKGLQEGIVRYEQLYEFSRVSTQTIFAKREVCMKHKFDRFVTKSQDYDWVIRAGSEYNFYYTDTVLVHQYFQSDSITKGGKKKSIEMCRYFLKKYSEKCKSNKSFHAALINQIAHNKRILGENPSPEYKAIYKITKSRKYLLLYLLFKFRKGKKHYV
ncbi:MAG: glycosyltransferase family 2 protein [Ruminococcus sp.]|nr:glycosyltransferase family 2 protein [Ruminococcus sp.]MDE6848096.1 glycosyltransferase family 2 protein [Ruminococcus sp.]